MSEHRLIKDFTKEELKELDYIAICQKCGRITQSYSGGETCIFCGGDREIFEPMTFEEYWKDKYSKPLTFDENVQYDYNLMLMHQPLECYDMEAYKRQVESYRRLRQKSLEAEQRPKCPICGSQNVKKLSVAVKGAKVGLFGLFGAGDLGKTYKCKNCGSKF